MFARRLSSRLVRPSRRKHGLAPPRRHSTSGRPPPPFPVVPSCPAPTCACAATPAMPEGLPIDRTGKLNGLMAAYAEQVLVCTGAADWPSRIEDARGGDNLAADLKGLFGRGGVYSDPFHHVSVLSSSFPPSAVPARAEVHNTSAYLLPSFTYVPLLPRDSPGAVEALARGYLLPAQLHPLHAGLAPAHRDRLTRQPAHRRLLQGVRPVEDVVVLVCGHAGRDMRCGVMGPALRDEFEAQLPRQGVEVLCGPVRVQPGGESVAAVAGPVQKPAVTARVGLVSHIGGHKFAGNVIIYLPPAMHGSDGQRHPLAGHGVWYGRVEPKHVQGLVQETVRKGRVIADMFRGGITPDRQLLRL